MMSKMQINPIALRLKMKEANINCTMLANALCVSRETVSNWRKGKNVTKGNLYCIAKILNVSPEELIENK